MTTKAKPKAEKGLTPKQERFVAEYLLDLNATAAYKRAGYVGKGNAAEAAASRLLSNAKVAAVVKSAMDKRSNDLGIDAAYVLRTIQETVERCKQATPVLDRQGRPVLVETPTGEVVPAYSFEPMAVLKGSELLGKHLKMFTDKTEHSGSIESRFIVHNA